jgi:subtilase family serine protease
MNQGLKPAEDALLSVYSQGRLVKDFELGDIDIGTRKVLTVENVRIPRGSTEIGFVIDRENMVDEIDKGNNRVDLVLAS